MNTNKRQIITLIICVAILAALVAIGFKTSVPTPLPTPEETAALPWPSREVEKLSVNEKTEHYDINASYPKTNSESISLFFKNFIENQISVFKEDTSWVNDIESASSQSLTLDIDYKIVESDTVENYVFNINSYTGGAHGMQVIQTFAYDKTGQLLTLSNMFFGSKNGLSTLSSLVQKELLKRPGADPKWISDGAGPVEENYSAFIATNEGLTILFGPYQVAPYSDGTIEISIPVDAFAKVANPTIFPPKL
jgi:hypothetical protein